MHVKNATPVEQHETEETPTKAKKTAGGKRKRESNDKTGDNKFRSFFWYGKLFLTEVSVRKQLKLFKYAFFIWKTIIYSLI